MKNFIFDFDGTLVESFTRVVQKFNHLAPIFNFAPVDLAALDHLRELSSKDFIGYFKIPLLKIPSVILKVRALLRQEMTTLMPFEGLKSVLKALRQTETHLGILTSNSSENVNAWLKHHELDHLFDFVHIESSYFGKSKILKKIIKNYQLDKSNTFYIGDETRDMDAAKASGIKAVAVTWGFNSENILRTHNPDFILKAPTEILNLL